MAAAALATTPARQVEVPNHCGFGVVEEVGPLVKRVQKGDRVVVAGTSQCGQCFSACTATRIIVSIRSAAMSGLHLATCPMERPSWRRLASAASPS